MKKNDVIQWKALNSGRASEVLIRRSKVELLLQALRVLFVWVWLGHSSIIHPSHQVTRLRFDNCGSAVFIFKVTLLWAILQAYLIVKINNFPSQQNRGLFQT